MSTTRTARRDLLTTRSTASFAVGNLGFKSVTGTVPITSAWVELDSTGTPTEARATLDLGAVDTGNERRDRDLRKPSLLDLDRHPTLTFAGRPQRAGDGWTVPGTLTGHGTSTPVTLTATAAEGGDGLLTVHATGELDRRDLGVNAPRFMIGRRVAITLDLAFAPAGAA